MLKVSRKGEFNVFCTGDNHCGIQKGYVTFPYECWVTVSNDALDEQGFVIDNAIFEEFFQNIGTTRLSCEQLCLEGGRFLFSKMKESGREHKIVEICVRIWGIPDLAAAEFLYTPGR